MTFIPVVANLDLSIESKPLAPYHRIAVVCRWKDAHSFRDRIPKVSIVGPLRTVRGIDLFVRNLLANPQIRGVVIAGADLTPGTATTAALFEVWRDPLGETAGRLVGDDIPRDLLAALVAEVTITVVGRDLNDTVIDLLEQVEACDRPSGRRVFPPRAPVATARGPAGDVGQRVAGDTLSDVWPRVLGQILDFGIEVPSKYGNTKELLGLISVIRDPVATADEIGRRPTPFTMSREELDEYTRRISTDYAPTEDVYSYGSRMADQIPVIMGAINSKPDDRGHFLTPWLPSDTFKPGGRPCLVGIQFRLLARRLHLFATFRSHDMFAAYPQNLAALCAWLVQVAGRFGHEVGSLHVTSVSAHLYDRDWNEAASAVEKARHGLDWDQRSSWRVEVVDLAREGFTGLGSDHIDARRIRATAMTPDGAEVVSVFEGATAHALRTAIERSGLVTTVGAALFLGEELMRAEAALGS